MGYEEVMEKQWNTDRVDKGIKIKGVYKCWNAKLLHPPSRTNAICSVEQLIVVLVAGFIWFPFWQQDQC